MTYVYWDASRVGVVIEKSQKKHYLLYKLKCLIRIDFLIIRIIIHAGIQLMTAMLLTPGVSKKFTTIFGA